MSDEVIKSFLVSLGFRVDQSSSKRFSNSILDAEVSARSLATVAATSALAIAALVKSNIVDMEALYYSSQRTRTPVKDIEALESGVARVGGTAEQARASLEGMAHAITTDPGTRGMISAMTGMNAMTANGQELYVKLIQSFAKMQPGMQEAWARTFGMNPETVRQIEMNLSAFIAGVEARKRAISSDEQAFADASKEYANSWRDVYDQMTNVGHVISIVVLPAFQALSTVVGSIFWYFRELMSMSFMGGMTKFSNDVMDWWKKDRDDHAKKWAAGDNSLRNQWANENAPKIPAKPTQLEKTVSSTISRTKNAVQQIIDEAAFPKGFAKYQNIGAIVPPLLGFGPDYHQGPGYKPENTQKNIILHQKTDIHLHGDTTNQAIKDIKRSTEDTNNSLIRNFSGKVR